MRYYLGLAYTKNNYFVVYLKFNFEWVACILPGNFSHQKCLIPLLWGPLRVKT